MKASKEHRVPLSARAITILEQLKQLIGIDEEKSVENEKKEADPFVFPGGKRDQPLSNMAFLMLLRRMKRDDLTAAAPR
jgi:integrase